MMQKDKEDHMKTKGRYDEAAKPDFLDMDKDGDKKEPMKKAVADKKMKEDTEFKDKLIEALKGKQHKIDKNKNNKIDAHDFAILRGQQKEEVKQIDEVSLKTATSAYVKRMGDDGPNEKSSIAKATKTMDLIAKKHGVRGVARATKTADDKYGLNDPVHNPRKAFVKQTMANLKKEEVEQIEEKKMTDAEMAKREKIVKSMKKGFAGFRQRYGKDAKSVMYATATKQAMKEDTVEEEIDPNIRTKDTLKGQEPTSQKDDVGPGSDAKSTKVKFRGGPMKEEVKKSDIPAFLRKARGDKPLTVADAKAGSKDSISSKENLAKARGVSEGKGPESDTVPFVTNADQPPFDKPYKKIGSTVTDKSGAKHTPMSRARDLARSAMKRIKTEMLGKAPGNNG
jgi:hypothetical protein